MDKETWAMRIYLAPELRACEFALQATCAYIGICMLPKHVKLAKSPLYCRTVHVAGSCNPDHNLQKTKLDRAAHGSPLRFHASHHMVGSPLRFHASHHMLQMNPKPYKRCYSLSRRYCFANVEKTVRNIRAIYCFKP